MMIAYFAFVVLVSLVCTVEISLQAFESPTGTSHPTTCREGILSLMAAIDRARQHSEEPVATENGAVQRFRQAREPAWSRRDAVLAACRGDEQMTEAFDAVVHLGFAEEHGVRREAIELGPFRLRARKLVQTYVEPSTPADSGT
ncbi:MAG: hypothetical protein MUF54_12230 [Polyangiaceae bacterium]|jgi:hypothetical protein|nr:hypothetical protein [Polyangiaceae bacterium]